MSQFQLGLNTSTIRPAGLMDKIRIAAETGYSGPVSFHSEYSGEPVDTVIDLARVDVRFIRGLLEK